MNYFKRTFKGFTLIEMLLVLVIMAAVIAMITTYSQQRMMQLKQDRTVLQMQQILNAGLAYNLNTTRWPTSLAQLQGDANNTGGYLPGPAETVRIVSPWGGASYLLTHTPDTAAAPNAIFAVCTKISAGASTSAIAKTIAGRLPMGYVADGNAACTEASGIPPAVTNCTGTTCTVVATVNVPGQNLNNARSVNLAGLYHHGACVPVPPCPNNMEAKIYVVPASVSGMNDGVNSVYPISSFTAYTAGSTNPSSCQQKSHTPCPCDTDNAPGYHVVPECPGIPDANQQYWRVCLQIITTKGQVNYKANYDSSFQPDSSTSYMGTTILAITRCAPRGENPEYSNWPGNSVGGSRFDVYGF